MSMQIQRCTDHENFDSNWIEQIILHLADAFDIRILWDGDAAFVTGAFAVAGGLLGGYAGGRIGAAVGAGIGSAAGLGVATLVTLREIWAIVKEKLQELVYIVWNWLRRLDAEDSARAAELLLACATSRRELAFTMLDFIAHKLGRQVLSSIAAT